MLRIRTLLLAVAFLCLAYPTIALAEEEGEPKKGGFAPVAEKTSGQLTTCGDSCGLRDALFSSDESLSIAVRKTGPQESFQPTGSKLVLQRQQDGDLEVVSGDAVQFVPTKKASEQEHFEIDLSDVEDPGEYTGALLFALTNTGESASVPVTLKVREGPLCPLLLLILAVFIGFCIRLALDQLPVSKFRDEATKLRTQIAALPAGERKILEPLWVQLWEERKDRLNTAEEHLKALQAGAEALKQARDAGDKAMRSPQAVKVAPWAQRIGSATSRLTMAIRSFEPPFEDNVALITKTQEEFEQAAAAKVELDDLKARASIALNAGPAYTEFKEAADVLQNALEKVSPDASQEAPNLEPLLNRLKEAFDELEKAHGARLELASAGGQAAGLAEVAPAVRAVLGWPQGPETVGMPEGKFSTFDLRAALGGYLSGAASIGVMLVLLAIGFKLTYLDNATFGTNLTDWLALVFWGLAAYGARQTLTGLGPSPAPTTAGS